MNTPANRSDRFEGGARTSFPQRKAFVLQFSADAGPQTGLFRGRVEHVASGEGTIFCSPEELWAFVRTALMRPAAELAALPAKRERAA